MQIGGWVFYNLAHMKTPTGNITHCYITIITIFTIVINCHTEVTY